MRVFCKSVFCENVIDRKHCEFRSGESIFVNINIYEHRVGDVVYAHQWNARFTIACNRLYLLSEFTPKTLSMRRENTNHVYIDTNACQTCTVDGKFRSHIESLASQSPTGCGVASLGWYSTMSAKTKVFETHNRSMLCIYVFICKQPAFRHSSTFTIIVCCYIPSCYSVLKLLEQ